jgi:hypothetical protein
LIPHYNVVFLTPGSSMVPAYVRSLVETTKVLNERGISYHYVSRYSSFVPTARELTALDYPSHDFASTEIAQGRFTYDKLMWIDSDIEWTPEDFLRLYESELDIISGLYVLDSAGTVAAQLPDTRGVPTRMNKVEFMLHDLPVEVGGVGFGFVCIKKGVFESIPRPWFLIGRIQWNPDSEMRVNVGEDYSWCGNAQRAGFKIWVDPKVKLLHHKSTVYRIE